MEATRNINVTLNNEEAAAYIDAVEKLYAALIVNQEDVSKYGPIFALKDAIVTSQAS